MSVQAMVKCIKEFNRFVETKDLVAHDVFPDGNCQFGAVLDQLRSHGDFRLSLDEIRQAAVDYLRQNPTAVSTLCIYVFVVFDSVLKPILFIVCVYICLDVLRYITRFTNKNIVHELLFIAIF